MRELWKPKLDLLVAKFGNLVKVTPRIVPSTREATFDFQSGVAHVQLKLSAYTNANVDKLMLAYDLEIIPVLMKYTRHAELEFPLDAVDKEAASKWLDDRLVDFVQTYLSMGETDLYLKESMVEDPIARVRFPNMAAACNLEWGGKKYYFISDETRREFATAEQNRHRLDFLRLSVVQSNLNHRDTEAQRMTFHANGKLSELLRVQLLRGLRN